MVHYLRGDSADELLQLLRDFNGPYEIISIYAVGSHHYAWVSLKKKK